MTAITVGSAVIYGWWAHGWQGLLLAIAATGAWAWFQFRRERRLIAQASARPAGQIDSVVMLQAHLAHGMEMAEVVALAGCLGRAYSNRDEWQWSDAVGNEIVVTFRRGVVVRWAVARVEIPDTPFGGASLPQDSHGPEGTSHFTGMNAQPATA